MIDPKHLHEWFGSAVDESIIQLNVKTLSGNLALEHLLYALREDARRNDRRLRDKYLRQYDHVLKGGWWVSGLDPLNDWEPMEWGRFKPDFARMGWDKEAQKPIEKRVKYESPLRLPTALPTCEFRCIPGRWYLRGMESPCQNKLSPQKQEKRLVFGLG